MKRMLNSFVWTAAVLSLPSVLHAAGFSLLEQTGSGIGYAYAGSAASADDVSAMYFNPAALTLLASPQAALAAHAIHVDAKFHDQGSVLPPAGLGLLPPGATSDNAGGTIVVPNAYLSWPVNERLALGFGLNAPFGLSTKYDDPWIGRFQGIRSDLKTLNANPALAWKVNDLVSLGLGVDFQHAKAELSNAVMLGAGIEGRALLDVDGDAWGWNGGAIFTLPTATRVGVSYRSRLNYRLTGDTTVQTLAGTPIPIAGGSTAADITFPDSAQLSAVQPLTPACDLRADVSYMHWSTIDTLTPVDTATGLPRDQLNFDFKDTVRVALGVGYKQSERWTWRAGVAWDQSPVRDVARTVRLPDGDRKWLAIGARWTPAQKLFVDAAYAHLFVNDTQVALTRAQLGAPAAFSSLVLGSYDNAVDILSLQLTWALR